MMSEDDRAVKIDAYYKLAERARGRFEHRCLFEWRFAISLWTLFGAGSVAVLTLDIPGLNGLAGRILLFVGIGFSVAALAIFYFWHVYLDENSARDRNIGLNYEKKICIAIGDKEATDAIEKIRAEIKRKEDDNKGWNCLCKWLSHLEFVSRLEFGFTVLLAVIFVGALCLKVCCIEQQPPTGVQVEGGSLTLDVQATLQLGDN